MVISVAISLSRLLEKDNKKIIKMKQKCTNLKKLAKI